MRFTAVMGSSLILGTIVAACGDEPGSPTSISSTAAFAAGFSSGILTSFVPGERPEGIAMSRTGELYVGISTTGNVYRLRRAVPPGGAAERSLFTTLGPGLLGLAVDSGGDLYAAVASFDAATHGVWRIAPDGAADRIAGSQAIFFPNALAFDRRGRLYITSSSGPPAPGGGWLDGQIWRADRGGEAVLWLQHTLLTGTGSPLTAPPFPLGANGIAFRHGELIVANTEKGLLVRVPVTPDGPGVPDVIATGLAFPDGLALDVHGDAYVAEVGLSRLVRSGEAGVEPVAGPLDGVHFATSVVFGTAAGDQTAVFLANAALPLPFPAPDPPGPSVLRVDAGVPGWPAH